MITAKQLRRPFRFLILAGVAITVGLFLRSRNPDEKLTLQPDDHSMEPVYFPGDEMRARRVADDFQFKRGQDVLYTVEKDGEQKGFVGRIQGLPGDNIAVKAGLFTCNGERIGPRAIPALPKDLKVLGDVPANKLLILNVNPDNPSDSRRFGFVPRDKVQAIILGPLK